MTNRQISILSESHFALKLIVIYFPLVVQNQLNGVKELDAKETTCSL